MDSTPDSNNSNDEPYGDESGSFNRDMDYISSRITADGSDGWPVEAGRYHLVVARACPWANRAIILRRLMGLEDVLSMGIAGPLHNWRSWKFHLDPDGKDPVLGIEELRTAFDTRIPGYPKGVTVPTIVDIPSGAVVTNNFTQITLDLGSQWGEFARDGAPELYPTSLRPEIDDVNEHVFHDVNNGVYKAGFASEQSAYESAYTALFNRLDWLEERLSRQRFLVGNTITEADVRLFPTLARFDAVYHGHFKCNRNRLTDMPNLWAYTRDLFQTPGFGDTLDLEDAKIHYYGVHATINPTGVIPVGPALADWMAPHDRDRFGDSPFGAGNAPDPVRSSEAGATWLAAQPDAT